MYRKWTKECPCHPGQTRGRGMRLFSAVILLRGVTESYGGPWSLRTMMYLPTLPCLFTFRLTSRSHVVAADRNKLASCTKSYALLHLNDLGTPTSSRFQYPNGPFSNLSNTSHEKLPTVSITYSQSESFNFFDRTCQVDSDYKMPITMSPFSEACTRRSTSRFNFT